MEIILREYGRTLLESLCVILLLITLFFGAEDEEGNQGVFAIAGAHMAQQSNDYPAYTDFDSFVNEGQKVSPEITYAIEGQMHTGENALSSCLSAKGYDGLDLPFKVIRVMDYFGNDYSSAYNETSQTISFPKPGVYKMRIQTVDNINQKTIVDISVPVVNP